MNIRVRNESEEELAVELDQFLQRLRQRPGGRRGLHLRATRQTVGKGLRALALVSLARKVGLRRAARIAALVIGAQAERPARRQHRFGG